MTAPLLVSVPNSVPRNGVAGISRLGTPTARLAAAPMASIQGTLALDLGITLPEPARLQAVRDRRVSLESFAARFAAVVVEVMGGDRGPQQLLRWTTEQVYADLVRRSAALHGAVPSDKRLRRLRAQVRSVHLFRPTEHSAELSVHVQHGQRSRAIAARIDEVDGRWQCTALQFG